MLHALQYSIIRHLRDNIAELQSVEWFFDGLSLTGKAKPFAVVEHMADQNELLAAGRRDFQEDYMWQIAIRTDSESELAKLKETVQQALRKQITLYETDGPAPVSAGFFYVDVNAFTPIRSDDPTNETDSHRGYFDVSVELEREV
jgi:hypothetical protein